MTEAIKAAKIVPNGRELGLVLFCECAAFKAGVQKNTKRYMLPSKKHDARPRVRIRLSEKQVLSALSAGVEEDGDDGDW